MREPDDLDAAGTGDGSAHRRAGAGELERALDRLDLLDDLDSLAAGGAGGLATGVEIFGEQLVHGRHDGLLDAFEPARDFADHTDVLDDLF